MSRVTRKSHYRGQYVTITWRDGSTTTGSLMAWGPQIVRIHTKVAKGTYTTVEKSTVTIDTVTEAVR